MTDRFERDADTKADAVIRHAGNAPASSEPAAAPHGAPLPPTTRAFFERSFGDDFRDVRVHAGSETARSLLARAFTVGNDIFFDHGEYAPGTAAGRHLIAHELAHVQQQRSAGPQLQMKSKEQWKLNYESQQKAQNQADILKAKGMTVYPVYKDGKAWTFDVDVLTKAEAEAEAKAAADPKYDISVEHEKHSDGYYVHKVLKCPEGLPTKAGYSKTWDSCFEKESSARKLVKKFSDAHIKAEVSDQQPNGKYGVYYAPYVTKADATKAAQADLGSRLDKSNPMYSTSVSEDTDLNSFTYDIDVACPKGYSDLGDFDLTVFPLAQESEFTGSTVTDPCGLKGTFNRAFLFQTGKAPRGVKMEGTGIAKDGTLIHYAPKADKSDCFEVVSKVVGSSGNELVPMMSVAVDPSVIPLKSDLLIESFGTARADDTGGMINKKHIDLYYGKTVSGKDAEKLSRTGKVCKKK